MRRLALHRRVLPEATPSAVTPALTARRLLGAAMLMAATLTPAGAVEALGFDYALDAVSVSGNLNFSDDFGDGLRNSPPTSAFADYNGTVTVEQGGFLILNSTNGSFPRPDLGVNENWIEGLVDLTTPIVDGGMGTTVLSASFRPDVPPAGLDGSMLSHYGVVLGTAGLQSVEIGVQNLFDVAVRIFFFDNRTGGFLGQDAIPPSSITGDIVLELVVDHATDTVLPRYSVDGGTTFVDGADWGQAATPGPIYDTGNDAFASFFAFGVPEPSVYLLLRIGLACLLAARRRGGSALRHSR